MLQQLIAVIIIAFFLSRLFWQKKKGNLSGGEFYFWLVFWSLSVVAVLSVRFLDKIAASLGISSSGIDILTYLSVLLLFYFIFRVRLRIEKMEKNITTLTREIALGKEK